MTEAKILICENCNSTVTDPGVGSIDHGTRVITIIEATDELDGNTVMSSNSVYGGNDKRLKRGVEAIELAGNDTMDNSSLTDEMVRVDPSVKPTAMPIKRDTFTDGVLPEMTQAIMEQRVDYDVNDEFVAANGHGYDAPRTRPVNNYRGYSHRQQSEPTESDEHLEDDDHDDFDESDHNSHYEYVPMEFDDEGNHR